jgi:starch phosphorylase
LDIIFEINQRFLETVTQQYPGDVDLIRRVSVIDESDGKKIRMSHLAIVGSHKINGVAGLHSELMKTTIFRDFARIYPHRFMNITNGVTPRRWLHQANPALSELITEVIGPHWIRDFRDIKQLEPFADDTHFRERFRAAKLLSKQHWLASNPKDLPPGIDPSSLFDVQIKRIHEYKRQLLNILYTVSRYQAIIQGDQSLPDRTVIFGGKAAPAYLRAKLIIKLINDVASVINNDPRVNGRLKVYFLPDYTVSRAMRLIPAIDLSEQISTAGTEASGTGNMKMAINGALTIGTYDGANIELREAVSPENFFLFGKTSDEIKSLRENGYDPRHYIGKCPELKGTLDLIASGYFSPEEPGRYQSIVDSLINEGDAFMLMADFKSYLEAQSQVDKLWSDPEAWTRSAILNIARSGFFTSDRAIETYAEQIWKISPRMNLQPGEIKRMVNS